MMALKLAVLVLCVWEQNKKDGTEKYISDFFRGLCNVFSRMWMCPMSLHQIRVTCSPQCIDNWLEPGVVSLSFCPFARVVGFLMARLPNHSMSGAENRQNMSKRHNTAQAMLRTSDFYWPITAHSNLDKAKSFLVW